MADKLKWYAEGVNFSCTGCGQCCTGGPGYIWLSETEIQAIAAHLNITLEEMGRKFLRRVEGNYSLVEKPGSYDCIFLSDKRCAIYPVRPTQCQTFPFWPSLLASPEAWREAAKSCEGIRRDAAQVPREVIEAQLEKQRASEEPHE